MKETKQEQLERKRIAWQPWKERLAKEQAMRKSIGVEDTKPIHGMARGNNKNKIKKLLVKFWEGWNLLESDELRLAALISLANKFKERVTPKRLRKLRKKFNKNKHHLLNIPNEKCATCPRKATVRHHIIPLTVGGINSPLNLILICYGCHEEIHPWMKDR